MGTPEIRTTSIHLIESPSELEQICQKITASGRVAIDTEFVWERTFYPNLGVVQLAINEHEGWLLDIPALTGKLKPLGEIIANPAIEKILHDAKQDLTILRQETGYYPQNIFDTRLAAGLVGPSATLSLLDCCAKFTGITLDKGETRSNWLKRPLTERQLQYALADVLFLPQIRNNIISQAKKMNRNEWLSEEMLLYNNPDLYEEPLLDQIYLKVKGLNRLNRKELAVLQKLAAWRELEARTQNRPRRHILSDENLLKIAQQQPKNIENLKKIGTLSKKSEQRYGEKLQAIIKQSQLIQEENHPVSLQHSSRQRSSAQSRKILDFIAETAEKKDIDPTLIATRKEIEKFLCETDSLSSDTSNLMKGWRLNLVGEAIAKLKQS